MVANREHHACRHGRRANVLVMVRHEYTPEKALTPSTWAQKLVELALAGIAADKPAPLAFAGK